MTDTIVNQVSLSQPADGHETTAIDLVVSWAANADSVGVDSYAVEVSKNTSFTNIAFTDTVDQARTSDTVTGLYNDTYYWRGRAIDDLGDGGAAPGPPGGLGGPHPEPTSPSPPPPPPHTTPCGLTPPPKKPPRVPEKGPPFPRSSIARTRQ